VRRVFLASAAFVRPSLSASKKGLCAQRNYIVAACTSGITRGHKPAFSRYSRDTRRGSSISLDARSLVDKRDAHAEAPREFRRREEGGREKPYRVSATSESHKANVGEGSLARDSPRDSPDGARSHQERHRRWTRTQRRAADGAASAAQNGVRTLRWPRVRSSRAASRFAGRPILQTRNLWPSARVLGVGCTWRRPFIPIHPHSSPFVSIAAIKQRSRTVSESTGPLFEYSRIFEKSNRRERRITESIIAYSSHAVAHAVAVASTRWLPR